MGRLDSPLMVALAALCVSFTGGWLARSASRPKAADLAVVATANASDLDLDVWARATASNGLWIHPGVRNLDPAVFGTVAMPLGTEFQVGVPLYNRLDDGQGNWTTTALPGPASNITSPLGTVSWARIEVNDRTPRDLQTFTSTTYDRADVEVHALGPGGLVIDIQGHETLPKGPFHEFFGGVGTNLIQHGRTGLGGKPIPEVFSYVSIYVKGEVRVGGQLLPGNDQQLIHVMVTQGIRDASNNPGPAGGNGPFLGNNAEVDRDDLELHVLMPGVRFLPNPLPNQPIFGVGQEFIHLIFEDVQLEGSTINGVLSR